MDCLEKLLSVLEDQKSYDNFFMHLHNITAHVTIEDCINQQKINYDAMRDIRKDLTDFRNVIENKKA